MNDDALLQKLHCCGLLCKCHNGTYIPVRQVGCLSIVPAASLTIWTFAPYDVKMPKATDPTKLLVIRVAKMYCLL